MKSPLFTLLLGLVLLQPLHHAAFAAQPEQAQRDPQATPEGLSKSDWQSIRAAYEAGRHAFMPVAEGWQARNPGQQWTTTFDRRGFLAKPRDGGWTWGLELQSYGFGEDQRAIGGKPQVTAEGQRLSYQWDATLQEWFVNDQRGLEHGFTVVKRPGGDGEKEGTSERETGRHVQKPSVSPPLPLSFTLSTRGTLNPMVSADSQGVLFQDAAGATVLNYTGLKVWDADGKVLPSRFEAAGERAVRLLVDESAARYPITIDPIAQQAYLKAHNTGVDDRFGYSVAVSGDTVVVGAYREDSSSTGVNSTPDDNATDAGAAYVFVRNGGVWSQQAYLKAHQVNAGDWFGFSVAAGGDTVVVGASSEDSSSTGVNSIANESASSAGAAYVFVRTGGVWTQQAYLKAHQVNASDFFGRTLDLSGDTVVVGAPGEDSSSTGVNSMPNESASAAGAAYVFVRNGSTWSQQAYLKPDQVGSGDWFGESAAVDGDTVVIGAYLEDSNSTGVNSTPNDNATDAGAAYVFVRNGTTWSQQAYLKAHQVDAGDNFGNEVALSGNTLVVTAFGEDSDSTGVNSTPNENAVDSGAAYVFVRNGAVWSQQAYLKAHQVNADDRFGRAVGMDGDMVVVGADWEDSSTTGVNNFPNESASNAGAAYVYVRSGIAWNQQAYLKAHQVNAGDTFGIAAAVNGGTVVIGATGEDSSTTGVDSIPNESASAAGAAYVFTGLGGSTPEIGLEHPAGTAVFSDTASIGFGSVTFGESSAPKLFTVRNTGAGPLSLSSISVTGGNSGDFTLDTTGMLTGVPTGGSTSFTVTFNPSAGGSRATTLRILSDDSDEGTFNIALAGTGLIPVIAVEQPTGSPLIKGASSVHFGTVALGSSSAPKTFTVKNTGTAPLTLSSVQVTGGDSGDFLLETHGMPTSVPAGGSISFSVTFHVTSAAKVATLRTAQLSLVSNDAGASPFVIGLQGKGFQIEAVKPTLKLDTPTAGAVSTTSPLLVSGIAGDNSGLDRVEVSLNSAPPVSATLGASTKPTVVPFSASVVPTEGSNSLTVTAYDLSGNSTTVIRSFTFTRRYALTLSRSIPTALTATPDTAGNLALAAAPSSAASALTPSAVNSDPKTSAVLPGKAVKLTATPKKGFVFSHWSGAPGGAVDQGNVLTFTMPAADVAVTAAFVENPFFGSAGATNNFQGLIHASGATVPGNGTEGFLSGTLIPASGVFTGKLLIGGLTQSFKATFYGDGSALFSVPGGRQPVLVFGDRSLTLSYNGGEIAATLTRAGDVSEGVARRGLHSGLNKVPVTGPLSRGTYTVVFPAKAQTPALPLTDYPQGDGYATLKLADTGKVTVSGVLADGTVFTASSEIVAGAQSPVFAQLVTPGASAKNKGGSFGGTLAFDTTQTDTDVSGADLLWFRPAVTELPGSTTAAKATQLYTGGWPQGIVVDAVGALYNNTLKVQTTLALPAVDTVNGNGQLDFSGGKLIGDVMVTAFNISGSAVKKIPATNTTFTLTLTQGSGAFKGGFTPNWANPATAKPAFKGILLQKGANRGGYGFFISNAVGDLDPESGSARLGVP